MFSDSKKSSLEAGITRTHVLLVVLALAGCLFVAPASWAQTQSASEPGNRSVAPTLNLNTYYQFPLSVGIAFQLLNPFWGDLSPYFTSKTDIAAVVRYPLPANPMIQPYARLGIMAFGYNDPNDPSGNTNKWTQNHFYAMVGAGYLSRVAKTFEFGADLAIGVSEAIYPHLDNITSGSTTVFVARSSTNLLASIGGRIGLDPSYNMSITVNPNLTYMYSLSPLTLFNGFMFNIGFSASYRFGVDPDSPQAVIRSIQFGTPKVEPVFAAMQSFYVDHPIGTVKITNTQGRRT